MAVSPESCIAPIGQIEPSIFAGDDIDLTERVTNYIAEGEGKVVGVSDPAKADHLVRLWVYHRAFSAVAQQLAGLISGKVKDNSYYILQGQFNFFNNKALSYLAEFEQGLTPTQSTTTNSGTVAVPTVVNW
jgi:hypothetical protein